MTRTRLYALTPHLAATLLLCVAGAQAVAADWQKVLSDRNRTVEIDRASIFDSDAGTKVSWGRVVMSEAGAAAVGYRTIKALNRYDCLNRSFFTIKRVYLDLDDRVLREETNADQASVMVTRNTADERMWREVCRPPGGADLGKIAEAAGKAAAAAKTAVPAAPPVTRPAQPKPAPATVAPAKPARPGANSTPPPKPPPEAAAKDNAPRPALDTSPTPVASPLPTIRPNLAELAARNEADRHAPLPATQGPEPRPASPTLPTPPLTALPAPPPLAPADEPADEPIDAELATTPQLRPQPALATPAPSMPAALAVPAAPEPAPSAPVAAVPAPALALATPAPARRVDPAPPAPAPAPATRPAVPAMPAAPDLPPRADNWSYAGETGPERWGRLRADWTLCADGERQSPIDLRDGIAVDLDPVRFDYPPTRFRITDTGNLLQVEVSASLSMEVRGERYQLEYFTLHRPSQERVGGGASDMAVHLHHRSSDGKPAILGVLMERGEAPNPLLQVLLNNLPLEKGSTYAPEATIDLGAFLPVTPGHYLYMGSLTTPPCTEGVLWVVMKAPALLSEDQLALFSRLYPRNSRPIQHPRGRRVLESR